MLPQTHSRGLARLRGFVIERRSVRGQPATTLKQRPAAVTRHAAWDDGLKGREVDVHVERQAMVCDPLPGAHADGGDLLPIDPNARQPRDALALQSRHLIQRAVAWATYRGGGGGFRTSTVVQLNWQPTTRRAGLLGWSAVVRAAWGQTDPQVRGRTENKQCLKRHVFHSKQPPLGVPRAGRTGACGAHKRHHPCARCASR
jgi:hypothetical protein